MNKCTFGNTRCRFNFIYFNFFHYICKSITRPKRSPTEHLPCYGGKMMRTKRQKQRDMKIFITRCHHLLSIFNWLLLYGHGGQIFKRNSSFLLICFHYFLRSRVFPLKTNIQYIYENTSLFKHTNC